MFADVAVVDTASNGQLNAVECAVRDIGFEVRVVRARHPTQDRPHAGEALPWVVSIVLAAPIAAFFTAIGTKAGEGAYGALKAWLNRVAAISDPGVYGHIEIVDEVNTRIDLRPKALPDEAFEALRHIDWSEFRGSELIWAEEKGVWLDRDSYAEKVARPYLERVLGRDKLQRILGEDTT